MNAKIVGRTREDTETSHGDTSDREHESRPAKNESDDDISTESQSISKDDAFHVLQNARRRAVLRYLLDHPDTGQFRMRDVAEEVAAWEHDTTVEQLVSDQRQRVYIALYQSHLPKLDEHGIIRYNQSRGVIETTELTTVFDLYLEDGLHAERDLTIDEAAGETDRSDRSLTRTITSFLD